MDDNTRECTYCKRRLPPEYFSMTSARGSRYPRAQCKDCLAMKNAIWFEINKDRVRKQRSEYMRKYRAAHREEMNQAARRKRRTLKEPIRSMA